MAETVATRIWKLTDAQALTACEALATGLELDLGVDGLDTTKFKELVAKAPARERKLHDDLKALSPAESAAAARSLLRLAADLGYTARVEAAIAAGDKHGRDLGLMSGPLLVAGLAVVLAYVPVEQRSKVTKIRSRGADGSERTEEVTEVEVKRVGATAAEKLASWWKAVLGG